MAGEDRLIDLDVRRTCLDERTHFFPDCRCEIESERLLGPIVYVQRQRGESHGPSQDRLHGSLRVRLSELPFVHEYGLLPPNRSADDRLSIVRVRVEVPHKPVDLDGREFPREVALAVVPGDLPIRDEVDADLILLTKDVPNRISLDDLEVCLTDFASV